jgi:hypothetical protein
MRKTKGNSGSKTGKSTSSGGVRKQVDLEILRRKIANYVGSRGLEMVKTTTDEVVKVGNLAALKYLFELIGVYPGEAGGKTEDADSDDLARALLNRLDIGGGPEMPAEPKTEAGKDSVE